MSNLVQDYLLNTLKKRFVNKCEWPLVSPDVNPLDYFFWDLMKTNVYDGRRGEPYQNDKELQSKIRSVWGEFAKDIVPLRKAIKQFVPRLKAIEAKEGFSTKMLFG